MDDIEAQMPRLLARYREYRNWWRPLRRPYSEAEAAAIEAAGEFAFPPLLRWYLLTVSRETTCSKYRKTVGCSSPLKPNRLLKESMDGCFVHVDGTDGQCGDAFTDSEDEECEDGDAGDGGERPSLTDGTLELGHDGCGSSYRVVVKGRGRGSVLEWMDFCDCYRVDSGPVALFDRLMSVRPESERSEPSSCVCQ